MPAKIMLNTVGLMSGTSMDGIDVALIRTDGISCIEEIAASHITYTKNFHMLLKVAELAINRCAGNIQLASQNFQSFLNHDVEPISLKEIFAQSLQLHHEAVIKLLTQVGITPSQVDVVGYHGQTFYHNPGKKLSVQIGDGKALSHQLGIRVVNNFRANDIAHGGQGAPFAPVYHQALALRDKLLPCVVVNCGGVANLSIITGPNATDILGYDAGPGNGLLDSFVKQRTNNHENCDRNGKYGINGIVNQAVLELLIQHSYTQQGSNYFELPPPKSLDVRDFSLIPEMQQLSLEDGCATLAAFTAKMIVSSLNLIPKLEINRWILAGGGWNNPVILEQLKYYLSRHNLNIILHHANEVGWNSQALEAQMIAFLAVRRLLELPISFPGTTTTPYPLIGGEINA